MSDTISREDAIEAVEHIMRRDKLYLPLNYKERRKALINAITMIKKCPSTEAEWIPCSERLPKEKARVLTYDTMGDVVFGQYDKGKWYWEAEACADYWAKNDGVIAWMPLPKPYREESEVEE